LAFAAMFDLLRREEQLARERAEAVITLSTEQGLPQFLAFGTFSHGGALAEQGQLEEGMAQIQQSLVALRATGTENQRTENLARLAAVYGKVGRIGEGLTLLAEALALVDKTGERWYEVELYRLKGELVLQSRVANSHAEAEAYFRKAIEIARKQQAKSLELRATMSLVRLWQQQGKTAKARDLLASIYGWFTEGFETKDLQEAQALLEELS
jgi:predicted ATPase